MRILVKLGNIIGSSSWTYNMYLSRTWHRLFAKELWPNIGRIVGEKKKAFTECLKFDHLDHSVRWGFGHLSNGMSSFPKIINQTKPGNFHLFFRIAAKYKSLRFLSIFSSISAVILIILLNINVFFYAWNGEAIFFL